MQQAGKAADQIRREQMFRQESIIQVDKKAIIQLDKKAIIQVDKKAIIQADQKAIIQADKKADEQTRNFSVRRTSVYRRGGGVRWMEEKGYRVDVLS